MQLPSMRGSLLFSSSSIKKKNRYVIRLSALKVYETNKGGQENFFNIPKIANSWAHSAIAGEPVRKAQIRKLLRLIYKSQIRKSLQNTARLCLKTDLKGSDQWKMRGVGKLASVRRWHRTMAIDVRLLFYLVVVFSATYFRFLFVKPS